MERRLYEIARKHCGNQKSFRIGLERLQEKTGSQSEPWEFRRMLTKIIADNDTHGHIPEYDFCLDGDFLDIVKREGATPALSSRKLVVSADAFEQARKVAKGWDIHALEAEWREWVDSKAIDVQAPDAHFIAFCKKRGPFKR